MKITRATLILLLFLSLSCSTNTRNSFPIDTTSDKYTEDYDKDGVVNAYDKEPFTPFGIIVDFEGKALDTDGDGVPDSKDGDPYSTKGVKVDAVGIELDTDGDGVPDSKDLEPGTTLGDRVDQFGVTISSQVGTVISNDKPANTSSTVIISTSGKSSYIYPSTNPKSIAFFCPKEMREENTYEVRANLGYFFGNEQIKMQLLSTINETRKEMNESPLTISDIVTKDVYLGKYMKIELLDPAEKFKILSVTNNLDTIKIFDDISNEYFSHSFEWIWKVTPHTDTRGQATLTLRITPYDENMISKNEEQKNYKIEIILKQCFLDRLWETANRNPDFAIVSIITPVVTFIAGLFIKKSKKEH